MRSAVRLNARRSIPLSSERSVPARYAARALALASWIAASIPASASPAENAAGDDRNLRPGLLSTLERSDGASPVGAEPAEIVTRLAGRVQPSTVRRWRGLVDVPDDETYELAILGDPGEVRYRLGTQSGSISIREPGTPVRFEMALPFGLTELEVEYRATTRGQISAYWRTSFLPWEPLGGGAVFHRDGPLSRALTERERGRRLAHRLSCAACHAIPGLPSPRSAPALRAPTLTESHLRARVRSPAAAHPGARMPEFDLAEDDVRAIARYLAAASSAAARTDPRPTQKSPQTKNPNARAGRRVVETGGCLACHTLGGVGLGKRHAGGPLDRAVDHRDVRGLRRWLSGAGSEQALETHRPRLPWRDGGLDNVVAFLTSLSGEGEVSRTHDESAAPGDGDASSAKTIIAARRCGACHALPDPVASPERTTLSPAAFDSSRSCLHPRSPSSPFRPRYDVTPEERRALEAYLRSPSPALTEETHGALAIDAEGCFSCHRRGSRTALGEVIQAVTARDDSLRGAEGALRPPALSAAGDKFPVGLIARTLRTPVERRPWLRVRMPSFAHLSPEEEGAIESWFAAEDRVPEVLLEPPAREDPPTDRFAVGHRLVGAAGFGCSSCHDLASFSPAGVAPNVRGVNLASLSRWMRPEFFRRWMRDPSRIVPGIEMPAIAAGSSPALGGDWDAQMSAIWEAINSPSFSAPPADRLVRELEPTAARAIVVRDVFRARGPFGEGWTPRAFAIGFLGGQNVLFDLDALSLRAWWRGRFAGEYTRGKTWLWEPLGSPIVGRFPRVASIGIRSEAGWDRVRRDAQSLGRLRGWRHVEDGVRVDYRLEFEQSGVVDVSETIRAWAEAGARRGFERRIRVRTDGERNVWIFAALDSELAASLEVRGARGALAFDSPGGRVEVAGTSGERSLPLAAIEDGAAGVGTLETGGSREGDRVFGWRAEQAAGGESIALLRYALEAGEPLEVSAAPPVETGIVRARERLPLVPGFRVEQLPLPSRIMPTAFAFPPAGEGAVVASLKGDVYLLRDADGDGFEDDARVIADQLAAPFGLAFDGSTLLVSHKPEILRLRDTTGDGFLDRADVVATGWGYTHDYHDWTVGVIPRGDRIYAFLGSDYAQAARDRATTLYRGKAIAVSVSGDIEAVARGVRYSVGAAKNSTGAIFFSDNQGVGNPFNEINHLRAGKIYGMPSLTDPEPDRAVRGEPPAIKIPHPWTRSVNGITFLEAGGAFGVFEGHGIGCELDNRMLIRFTLDRIGDTYQGACYPLSRSGPDGPRLLGPLSCAVSPAGRLYVGNLHDSGWGGGANVGSILRLELAADEVPTGIREVRAWRGGFDIEFTRAVARAKAVDPGSYRVSGYQRIWKGGYATPDRDRHEAKVIAARLAATGRSVRLEVGALRPGFLYDIQVDDAVGGDGTDGLWPRVAHYTLNRIPTE